MGQNIETAIYCDASTWFSILWCQISIFLLKQSARPFFISVRVKRCTEFLQFAFLEVFWVPQLERYHDASLYVCLAMYWSSANCCIVILWYYHDIIIRSNLSGIGSYRELLLWLPPLIYTDWHHLDLTKQIGKSLLLDHFCMGDYLSAGNKIFNSNWCNE